MFSTLEVGGEVKERQSGRTTGDLAALGMVRLTPPCTWVLLSLGLSPFLFVICHGCKLLRCSHGGVVLASREFRLVPHRDPVVNPRLTVADTPPGGTPVLV